MTIKKIKPIHAILVETADGTYTRYSPQNWTERMGESDETVYDCTELEAAFQKFASTYDNEDAGPPYFGGQVWNKTITQDDLTKAYQDGYRQGVNPQML